MWHVLEFVPFLQHGIQESYRKSGIFYPFSEVILTINLQLALQEAWQMHIVIAVSFKSLIS